MEEPEITISLALAIINLVGLIIGYKLNKFKLAAICLIVFNLLTIIIIMKLI